MADFNEMEPLVTKVRPFLFLVELSPDPARRKQGKQFLTQLLQSLHNAVLVRKGMPIFVGIYPFGADCREEPVFPESCCSFDVSTLEGNRTTPPAQMLHLLNKHLSISEKLNFPVGAYLPTILFIGDWKSGASDQAALEVLEKNNWFRHADKWLFCWDTVSDPEFSFHFVSPGREPIVLPPDGRLPGDNTLDPFRIFDPAGPQWPVHSLMGSLMPTDSALTDLLQHIVRIDPVSGEEDEPEEPLMGIDTWTDDPGEGYITRFPDDWDPIDDDLL